MRRSTAISQVLLLLAFQVLPLFASSLGRPVCCRRDGAHHCAMQERSPGDQTAFGSAVYCPYSFPAFALTHAIKLFLPQRSVATIDSNSGEIIFAHSATRAVMQPAAGVDNRGPPALTL